MSKALKPVNAWALVVNGKLTPIVYTDPTSVPARVTEVYKVVRVEIRAIKSKKKD
jgi:hypothetical protein